METKFTEMGAMPTGGLEAMPTGMPHDMPNMPGMQNLTSMGGMGDMDITCKISVSPKLCSALIILHLN